MTTTEPQSDAPVRPPTDEELDMIVDAVAEQSGLTREELTFPGTDYDCSEKVAVYEHYATDSPGYGGRLAIWVWGNGTAQTIGFNEDGAFSLWAPGDSL